MAAIRDSGASGVVPAAETSRTVVSRWWARMLTVGLPAVLDDLDT
ncbi:hypothetical protein [Streptomyces sp. SD15]